MAIISASEESLLFMISSLKLGAHHCICFEDLSEVAILKRIEIFKPDLILCRPNIENKIKNVLSRYKLQNIPNIVLRIDDLKKDNFFKNSVVNNYSSSFSSYAVSCDRILNQAFKSALAFF